MIFGTFDLLHPGHMAYIKEASAFGRVHAVIATDAMSTIIKGKKPYFNQTERQKMVNSIKGVSRAIIGNSKDPYRVIKKENPSIILLGYDQTNFVDGLYRFIKKNNLKIKILRAKAFKPSKYKTSKIKIYA